MVNCDPGLNALDWTNRRSLAQAGFSEATVDSPVGRQTFFAAGSGRPLVLLHGAGDHAGSWANAAAALLERGAFRVMVPDLAGRGTSAPFEGSLDMETAMAGLHAVLNLAEGPLILVGNSMGAWAAMLWAAAHPARVERLVPVNGGPILGLRSDVTLTPPDRGEARRLWQAMMDPSRWEAPDLVLDELIRKGRVGAIGRMPIESMMRHLMDGRLGEIAAPVDLIWGESDQLLSLDYARRLLGGLRAARLTTIPGCGHVPHLECPERFNAALRSVLDQAPPVGNPL